MIEIEHLSMATGGWVELKLLIFSGCTIKHTFTSLFVKLAGRLFHWKPKKKTKIKKRTDILLTVRTFQLFDIEINFREIYQALFRSNVT